MPTMKGADAAIARSEALGFGWGKTGDAIMAMTYATWFEDTYIRECSDLEDLPYQYSAFGKWWKIEGREIFLDSSLGES